MCENSFLECLYFTKIFKKYGIRRYIHCPECDLIFVPEEFHLSARDEVARYKLHQNDISNEGYVRMFLAKITLLRKYCANIRTILDYGSGHEQVLIELLKKEKYDCYSYDLYFHPEFPQDIYDLVISTEVFEHMRDVKSELIGMNSLIKPGGYLAVMTSFHDQITHFKDWWYNSDPTHICFFSMKTFIWISRQFGFEILYSDRKNFIIFKKCG